MLVTLLCLIFAPVVDRTGANLYRTRERASTILAACWPLSEPALAVGRRSADMEVRRRCERATPKDWRADLTAAGLLTHRHERSGLPLADPALVPQWHAVTGPDGIVHTARGVTALGVTAEALRAAVIRLANANGIDTSDEYYFGETQFWSHPTGYDFVRMKLLGVWPPQCESVRGSGSWMPLPMIEAWTKQKGR